VNRFFSKLPLPIIAPLLGVGVSVAVPAVAADEPPKRIPRIVQPPLPGGSAASRRSASARSRAAAAGEGGDKAGAKTAPDTGSSPPGSAPEPTTSERIATAVDTPYKPKPGGHLVKFNLTEADLSELVNWISGLTGKRFIYGAKLHKVKATVVSPTPVTLAEAYEAFLAILEANGMTVIPHGPFLKIVDTGKIQSEGTPIYGRGTPLPNTDRYITRLYRVQNAPAEEISQLLTKFKTKEGDISVYAPGQLLIITDTGSNIRRMIRLLEEVDVGGVGSKMWIEPVHYGAASDLAKQITDIFDVSAKGGGASGLAKVVADDQSNSLVLVGTEEAYHRVLEFMRRVDTPPAAEGRIHVLPLQHSVAEELGATLTQMLSGSKSRSGAKRATGGAQEGLFEGEVRVTADKATNSLVITSSARDYAQVRLVIQQLDMPRRQVFIEAVIMDLNVSNSMTLGLAYHGGASLENDGDGGPTVLFGGLNPATTILPPSSAVEGLAFGVRGPQLPGTENVLGTGFSIPAFGVALNALQQSGDANVLATPHIIATDNVPALINVGQNIPLQTNAPGLNLPGIGGAGTAVGAGGVGFSGFNFNAPRQDIGTQIKVTPHINDSNQVRLEIEEEISEQGATVGSLGAVSIIKRNANTTVVVGDQETVVIGGLMRDAVNKKKTKIPVLGDLPLLGFLFRSTTTVKTKTNLLLILTPHIIRSQKDLRQIFERKMQERQEFLDRVAVFGKQSWEAPRDWTRTNGLVEQIRQSYAEIHEQERLEADFGRKRDLLTHEPSDAIDMPRHTGKKGQTLKINRSKAKPKKKSKRKKSKSKKRSEFDTAPIQIRPIARSVTRVE
jgi:general secretion pathway protein D